MILLLMRSLWVVGLAFWAVGGAVLFRTLSDLPAANEYSTAADTLLLNAMVLSAARIGCLHAAVWALAGTMVLCTQAVVYALRPEWFAQPGTHGNP